MPETTAVPAAPAPSTLSTPSTTPATAWVTAEAVGTCLFGTSLLAAAVTAFAATMTVLAVPLVVFGLLGWVVAGFAWRERRTQSQARAAGGTHR